MHRKYVWLFPRSAFRKLSALGACLLLAPSGAYAQTPTQTPIQTSIRAPGRLVVPRAARVDIGHTGIHTHLNFIYFDTGTHDLAAMQADTIHFPHLTLCAHSRLPTDHAALPPGLAIPGDPPLENPYGPMERRRSRAGWGIVPLHQVGRGGAAINEAKVVVPTRFANWVALQPPARRKAYLDPRQYWLEVCWGDPLPVASGGERI